MVFFVLQINVVDHSYLLTRCIALSLLRSRLIADLIEGCGGLSVVNDF
jgi:hypothetical protein